MSSAITPPIVTYADVPDSKYITIIYNEDVLFGRGSGPNDHEGNIRFRNYVIERKAEYMATSHRVTKTNIARDIVNLVISANGRFLKKLEPDEVQELNLQILLPNNNDNNEETNINYNTITFYEIQDDDTIMEKAKQALRQNATKFREEQQMMQQQQQQRVVAPPVPLSRFTTVDGTSSSAMYSNNNKMNTTDIVTSTPSYDRRVTAPADMRQNATDALRLLFGDNSNFDADDLEPYPSHIGSLCSESHAHNNNNVIQTNNNHRSFSYDQNLGLEHDICANSSGGTNNAIDDGGFMIPKHPYDERYSVTNINSSSQQQQNAVAADHHPVMQMNAIPYHNMSSNIQLNNNINNNNVIGCFDNNNNNNHSSNINVQQQQQQQQQQPRVVGVQNSNNNRRRTIHVMPQLEETMPISNEDMMGFNRVFQQLQQQLLVQQNNNNTQQQQLSGDGNIQPNNIFPQQGGIGFIGGESNNNNESPSRRSSSIIVNNDDFRRISLTVNDLMRDNQLRRKSSSTCSDNNNPDGNMDDLLDSFNAMSTATGATSQKERDDLRKLMSSQETMGTIEQLGSVADMSIATVDGSMFSTYGGMNNNNNNVVDTRFLDNPPSSFLISTNSAHSSNRKASITSVSTFGGFSMGGMNESSMNGFIDQIRDGESEDDEDYEFFEQVKKEVENDMIIRKQQHQQNNNNNNNNNNTRK